MNKRKRIEYLLVTLAAFVSGILLYGGLGKMSMQAAQEAGLNVVWPTWQVGGMGGYLFGVLLSSAILASRFFAKRKLWVKVLAAFFCFPLAGVFMLIGMISFVPYWIYNLIRVIIDKPQSAQDAETDSEDFDDIENYEE